LAKLIDDQPATGNPFSAGGSFRSAARRRKHAFSLRARRKVLQSAGDDQHNTAGFVDPRVKPAGAAWAGAVSGPRVLGREANPQAMAVAGPARRWHWSQRCLLAGERNSGWARPVGLNTTSMPRGRGFWRRSASSNSCASTRGAQVSGPGSGRREVCSHFCSPRRRADTGRRFLPRILTPLRPALSRLGRSSAGASRTLNPSG